MRRVLPLLLALLVLAACGGSDTGPLVADTAEPVASEAPGATPTPTPTPTPEAVLAPLTGLEVDDADVLERPVFAVKIDNHPAAQPQSGIELADVVLNELVEGGMTRFIALYHSTDPGDVGPVRSGREVDALIAPAFTPVFGFSGAASEVIGQLRAAGLHLRTEGDAGWFRRSRPGVAREHTLYVTVADQWAAADGEVPAAEPPWAIDTELPDGRRDVDGVELHFSNSTTVGWDWDGERFVRTQYGGAHAGESGDQVAAANVVVPRVEVRPGPRGGGTVAIDVIGEGDALVFRDGAVYEARWRKDGAEDPFEWLTLDGDPLPLAPGRTWVELVPSAGDVLVREAGTDSAGAGGEDGDG